MYAAQYTYAMHLCTYAPMHLCTPMPCRAPTKTKKHTFIQPSNH